MRRGEARLFVQRSVAKSCRDWARRITPTDISITATAADTAKVRAALIEHAEKVEQRIVKMRRRLNKPNEQET